MLREFIAVNRGEILAQASARVAERQAPLAADAELTHGLPVFLDQLGEALRRAGVHLVPDRGEITNSASHHGEALFHQGLTVAQVINGYGDLCQVITGLVVEKHASISAGEFQTLNLCLDEATAGAVTSFSRQRERAISDEGTERLGVLAHEMRNALNIAILSFRSIKKGAVAVGGSTGELLDRSHLRLQSLIDRSLADVRLDAGLLDLQRVPVWEVLAEVEIGATMMAQTKGIEFAVTTVDPSVIVEADRPILAAALSNLLQNAFKFTLPGTKVELHIRDLPGKGCIFTIDLPKQPPPPTPIHSRDAKTHENRASSRKKIPAN